VWIENNQREQAQTAGYTVVDASTVVATHLSELVKNHAQELLGHEEVQELLDILGRNAPKLVEDLVPNTLSLGLILKVLQNLLAESVASRDVRTIAETLAAQGAKSQDADVLTAHVRTALGRSIVQQLVGPTGEIPVITLDPGLERLLRQSLQAPEEGGIALEPGLAERLHNSLKEAAERQEMAGQPAVLLVPAPIRLWLARFLRPTIPTLAVLAYTELPDNRQIRVVASVGQPEALEAGNVSP